MKLKGMGRRTAAWILTLVMVLGSISPTVFAEELSAEAAGMEAVEVQAEAASGGTMESAETAVSAVPAEEEVILEEIPAEELSPESPAAEESVPGEIAADEAIIPDEGAEMEDTLDEVPEEDVSSESGEDLSAGGIIESIETIDGDFELAQDSGTVPAAEESAAAEFRIGGPDVYTQLAISCIYDLYVYLPVTVVSDNSPFTISSWERNDASGELSSSYWAENIYVKLMDSENNPVRFGQAPSDYAAGNYKLTVRNEAGTVLAEKPIQVIAMTDDVFSGTLSLSAESIPFELSGCGVSYYKFIPERSGDYAFVSEFKGSAVSQIKVYGLSTDDNYSSFTVIGTDLGSPGSGERRCAASLYNAEAGKPYIFMICNRVFSASGNDGSVSGSVYITERKEIQSIEYTLDSQYDIVSLAEKMSSLEVTVHYTDDSEPETVKLEDGSGCTKKGDRFYVIYKVNNGIGTSFGGLFSFSSIPWGKIEIEVYSHSGNVSEKKEVEIVSSQTPPGEFQLEAGDAVAYTIPASDTKSFYRVVKSVLDGSHLLSGRVYEIGDTQGTLMEQFSILDYASSNSKELEFDINKEYLIVLENSSDQPQSGTIMKKEPIKTAVINMQKDSFDLYDLEKELPSVVSVTVTYENGTSQTISEWNYSEWDAQYIAQADNGDTVSFTLMIGDWQIGCSAYTGYEEPCPYGLICDSCTLKVSVKDTRGEIYIEEKKDITVNGPSDYEEQFQIAGNSVRWYAIPARDINSQLEIALTQALPDNGRISASIYQVEGGIAENLEGAEYISYTQPYKISLTKRTKYLLLLRNLSSAEAAVGTIRETEAPKATRLAFSTDSSVSEYRFYDFYRDFSKDFQMTAYLSDGSSDEITSWDFAGDPDDAVYCCGLSNGEIVYFYMEDASGQKIKLPSYTQVPIGKFTLTAYMNSEDSAVRLTKEITVSGSTAETESLALDTEKEFSFAKGEIKYCSLMTAAETDYVFSASGDDGGELYIDLYDVTDSCAWRVKGLEFYSSEQYGTATLAGNHKYVAVMREDAACGWTVKYSVRKGIESVAIGEIPDGNGISNVVKLLRIPVQISYTDGTSEGAVVNGFGGSVLTANGDYVSCTCRDASSLPVGLQSSVAYGAYTFKVTAGEKESETKTVQITGDVSDCRKLGEYPDSYSTNGAGEYIYYTVDPQTAAKVLNVTAASNVSVVLYSLGESSAAFETRSYDTDMLAQKLLPDTRYFLAVGSDAASVSGEIGLRNEKQITSVSLPDIGKLSVFGISSALSKLKLTINYSENDTEEISSWTYDWAGEEDELSGYERRLVGRSLNGDDIILTIKDERYFPYPGEIYKAGNYSLEVRIKNIYEPPVYTADFTVVPADQAEDLRELNPGSSETITLGKYDSVWYSFTPTVTETYRLSLQGGESAHGDLYDDELKCIDEFYRHDPFDTELTAGKTYYCCVTGKGEITVSFTKMGETAEHSHDFSVLQEDKAATCTEAGSQIWGCSVAGCTQTKTVTIDPLGHDLKEEVSAATCTAAGSKRITCSRCDYSETVQIDPLGHSFSTTFTIDTPAACTTAGSQSRHCTRCGAKTEETAIPAAGHKWNAGEVTKKASCTETGEKTFTCTACGEKMTEAIPAAGHKWGSWTEKKATVFEARTRIRTCTVCREKEKRVIGSPLKAAMTVPKSLTMKVKQKSGVIEITGLANGDSVDAVTSSNKKVVKVTNLNTKKGTFRLSALKKGSAKITVRLESGAKKTFKVTVQEETVKTEKLTLKKKNLTLKKGKSVTLKPVIEPITSQEKVTFASSNEKVATVNAKGVVKAKKAGTVKITIKSGKKKVVCKIKVKK